MAADCGLVADSVLTSGTTLTGVCFAGGSVMTLPAGVALCPAWARKQRIKRIKRLDARQDQPKTEKRGGSDIPGAACGLAELALELGVLCVSMKSMDGASLFSSLSLLTFLRFKGAPFDSRSQVEQIQSPTGTLAILQHWTCAPLGHLSHNSMTIAR